jgi:hypothetical protein
MDNVAPKIYPNIEAARAAKAATDARLAAALAKKMPPSDDFAAAFKKWFDEESDPLAVVMGMKEPEHPIPLPLIPPGGWPKE